MMTLLLAKFEENQKNVLERFDAQKKEQDNVREQLETQNKNVLEQLETQRNEQKTEQENVLKQLEGNVLKQLEAQRNDQKQEQQNILERFDEQKNLLEGRFADFEEKIKTLNERVEEQNARFKIIDEQIETITKELEKVRKLKVIESSGECLKKREVQPPSFDGQIPWSIYKKQFEAAALTNGWNDGDKCIALTLALRGSAAELLQTIPAEKSGDFSVLVSAIERRFGDSHMTEVFRVQLNNRTQKRGETLQQLQSDIERLVHLAYPTAGNEIRDQLAVEAFVRAVADINLQRAIRIAGKRTLPEALAFALTMEAAEKASQSIHRVREVEVQECSCQKATVERRQQGGRARCWNCNENGHLQRQCRLPRTNTTCQHCENISNSNGQGKPNNSVTSQVVSQPENKHGFQHRRRILDSKADVLSWRPNKQDSKRCRRQEGKEMVTVKRTRADPIHGWSNEELRKAQQEDPDIEPILAWKEHQEKPEWADISDRSPTLKAYWAQWDSLYVQEGVLRRKWESADGKSYVMQLVLPRSKIMDVLREMHDGVSGGHLGVNKTLEKVRQRFYWLHAREDVEKWCRKCDTCAATKGPNKKNHSQMQQYNVGSPFERIAIDVAGPFPETNNGNRYILVVMDYFSKWPEAYAIPNQEAKTVADQIVFNWVSRFGVPLELHSDQGRNFESNIFQEVCGLLHIKKTRTTPLHPQSDGMVERFNRTLKEHLCKVVDDNQRDWDRHIPLFLMAYRSARHSSTGHTPSEILMGRNIRLPSEIKFGCPTSEPQAEDDYLDDLRERLLQIHDDTRSKIKMFSDRMKTRYDIRATTTEFQAGDRVWLYNPHRQKGLSPKLQRDWEGPYTVISKINDVVYRIQKGVRGKLKVVHRDRLHRYSGDENDGFVRDDQS